MYEALFLISESSEGSLRDALQILDRMINFCENEITINEVSKNLNIVGSKLYLEICDEIIEKNIPKVLLMLDEIILNGFSEVNFIIGLSNHFRNLFFCKNNNTFKLIESSEKLKEFYLEQSNKVDITWIRKGLKIINTFEINFKNINNKRIHAELCLMQISSIKKEGKNISKKKDNFKNNNKLLDTEKNKSDVNTKNTENLVPKNNYKAKENTKSELEKKSTESDKSINEVSSYSLASVEKKKIFNNRKINTDFSKSKPTSQKNNFTQENLENYWDKYHNHKQQNKEFNIASLLKISKPKKNGNIIEYSVTSDINKKELEDELPELLSYIKTSLKNNLIEIKFNTNNSIKKNILYTPSEKFEKLVELNPSLEILRKKLDLDY